MILVKTIPAALYVVLLGSGQLSNGNPLHDNALQKPLLNTKTVLSKSNDATPRKLHGRFLHITDIHPDPFYLRNSSTASSDACHRSHGRGGLYGAPTSDCDSPIGLANATFKWIKENLRDQVDFVVWTGDNARHDNDVKHPRTEDQIFSLNQMMVNLMVDTFKKTDDDNDDDPTNDLLVPVIPSMGNNDILPHNIMIAGPTYLTRTYLNVWRHFIPENEKHVFERGAYFSVEVIPNRLTVFSLNTMYFFSSNTATDGCEKRSEPGYDEFQWLKVQLGIIRQRKMKAILTGHVPPALTKNKESWDVSCWKKYAVWIENYRDVVIGNIFGHMNMDHFELLDTDLARGKADYLDDNRFPLDSDIGDHEISTQSDKTFLSSLRRMFAEIPSPPKRRSKQQQKAKGKGELRKPNKGKKRHPGGKHGKYLDKIGGAYAERYIPILVAPSVIPNYFPAIRVIEYNVTGIVDEHGYAITNVNEDNKDIVTSERDALKASLTSQSKARPRTRPKHPFADAPDPPPTGSAPGPAYSPQTFSFLGITQYYANLTYINGWVPRQPGDDDDNDKDDMSLDDPQPKKPRTPPQPFSFSIEYNTRNDSQYGYGLNDLTTKSLLGLAQKIGKGAPDDEDDDSMMSVKHKMRKKNTKPKKHKGKKGKKGKKRQNTMWRVFLKRAFVGAVDDEVIKDIE